MSETPSPYIQLLPITKQFFQSWGVRLFTFSKTTSRIFKNRRHNQQERSTYHKISRRYCPRSRPPCHTSRLSAHTCRFCNSSARAHRCACGSLPRHCRLHSHLSGHTLGRRKCSSCSCTGTVQGHSVLGLQKKKIQVSYTFRTGAGEVDFMFL